MIATWVVVAVVVIAAAPALQSTSNESEFLPDHYESIQATQLQVEKFPGATTPAALLVFQREAGGPLTEADQAQVQKIATELGPELSTKTFQPQVVTVSPDGTPNVSEDGTVQIGVVGLAEGATGFDAQAIDDAMSLRGYLEELAGGTGLRVQSTGAVPQALDSQEASQTTLTVVGTAEGLVDTSGVVIQAA